MITVFSSSRVRANTYRLQTTDDNKIKEKEYEDNEQQTQSINHNVYRKQAKGILYELLSV